MACRTAWQSRPAVGGGGGVAMAPNHTVRHHLDHESGALVNPTASLGRTI
jgi:hypothetical protein